MKKDIIGRALLDFYAGHYSTDIIVKSSIAEDDIILIPYLFRTEDQLPQLELKALKLCRGAVLDVGAGSGCHSVILQEKGFNVTAIDVSKGAVEVMQKRGLRANNINFFDEENKYDTLLCLMNGVGIAETLFQLETFLLKAKSLLNKNGQILMDSSDISYMYSEKDGSKWIDLNKNYFGEVTYQIEYKNLTSDSFDWLFIDYNTMEIAAKNAGLNCENIMDGEHYDYLARLWV